MEAGSLTLWKSRRYTLSGRLGGFQSRYGRVRDRYNVMLLSGFETRLLGCPVRSLATTPNDKFWILTDVRLFYLNQACTTRGPRRVMMWSARFVIFSNFTALSEYKNKYFFAEYLIIFLPVKYSSAHSTPTYIWDYA